MRVILLETSGTERLNLAIFIDYDKQKIMEIIRNELALKLSGLLSNPTAAMILYQLPWITAITYRNNSYEISLTYNLLRNENSLCSVLITELDEDIIKIFNQYYF